MCRRRYAASPDQSIGGCRPHRRKGSRTPASARREPRRREPSRRSSACRARSNKCERLVDRHLEVQPSATNAADRPRPSSCWTRSPRSARSRTGRASGASSGISDGAIRGDIELACRDAGIASYHPHQLRHRRCSLWLAHGFEPVFVKQWSGHSKASMLTDVYGHVVLDPSGDDGAPSGSTRMSSEAEKGRRGPPWCGPRVAWRGCLRAIPLQSGGTLTSRKLAGNAGNVARQWSFTSASMTTSAARPT